jgi:hypothetical protein
MIKNFGQYRYMTRKLILLAIAFLCGMFFQQKAVFANSQNFTIDVVSIDALLVDRSTGSLSKDIIGADESIFLSKGNEYDTTTKSADDVFLRVALKARGDGNIQPNVSLLVLGRSNSPQDLESRYAQSHVVHWEELTASMLRFDDKANATVTALLKGVTCTPLDVIVHVEGVGGPNGMNQSIVLPFECRP